GAQRGIRRRHCLLPRSGTDSGEAARVRPCRERHPWIADHLFFFQAEDGIRYRRKRHRRCREHGCRRSAGRPPGAVGVTDVASGFSRTTNMKEKTERELAQTSIAENRKAFHDYHILET